MAMGQDRSRQQAIEITFGPGRQIVNDALAQLSELIELNSAFLQQPGYGMNTSIECALVVADGRQGTLLIGTATAIWLSLGIGLGLGRVGRLAQAVAAGDLTETIAKTTRDEIGELVGHINRWCSGCAKW